MVQSPAAYIDTLFRITSSLICGAFVNCADLASASSPLPSPYARTSSRGGAGVPAGR
jgi:hypothetical protein